MSERTTRRNGSFVTLALVAVSAAWLGCGSSGSDGAMPPVGGGGAAGSGGMVDAGGAGGGVDASGSDGSGGAAGAGGAASDAGANDLEPWDTTGAGPLSGIFAVEYTINATALVLPVTSRQLLRLRVLQSGTQLRLRDQMCKLSLPAVAGVATVTVPAALQALIRSKITDETGNYLSNATAIGATLASPQFLSVLGANLANPATDALPSAQSPGSAVDEDQDGHPGVTLQTTSITCNPANVPHGLFVALRTAATFSATVTSNDAFAGSLTPVLDQSILGNDDACLNASGTVTITVAPGSSMKAVRVDTASLGYDLDANGNVDCDEIVKAAPALFGVYWN